MKRWAFLTVLLYGVMLALLAMPLMLLTGLEYYSHTHQWTLTKELHESLEVYHEWMFWVWLVVMLAGQALLLLVPLDLARERPVSRRKLRVPVVTAGFLLGLIGLTGLLSLLCLFLGDWGIAVIPWSAEKSSEIVEAIPALKQMFLNAGFQPDDDFFSVLTIIGLIVASWMIWGLIFYRATREDDAASLSVRAMRWLLRGSILNLLVAVPTHVVVRHRDDCCAPAASFAGIVTGISVMLLSFGPGVLFLFAARRRRLQPSGRPRGT